MDAETGGLDRWWPLFGVAVLLLVAFAYRELRTARRRRQPLLDPQLARTSGYAAGSGIGLVYFMGFTGSAGRTAPRYWPRSSTTCSSAPTTTTR